MEWLLELLLVGLLIATMFHALRLERALGVLKRDRAALEELVAGFNASTRAAEQGIERLRDAADGAGRQIARQVEVATSLKDDLTFLSERGTVLADRLELLVRQGRGMADSAVKLRPVSSNSRPPQLLGQVSEREPGGVSNTSDGVPAEDAVPRVRSQAERDLIRALRMAR